MEPKVADPWPGLRETVARFGATTSDLRSQAIQDWRGVGDLRHAGGWGEDYRSIALTAGDEDARQVPMRVVLMGRTQAGKSSILAVLTGSHFDRIGDGRQRFSRDVFPARATASDGLEIVDTPGVGARHGVDDTEVALMAALDADLVVWVNSGDSIQAESADALRHLGLLGKPILVVINCGQDLEGVGKLNLLRHPDRVFGNKEGLVEEIRRHLARAGVEPLDVVYVHALSAREALQRAEVDAELYAASRVDELTQSLLREHLGHNDARRAIRLVDAQRQKGVELAYSVRERAGALRAHAEHERRQNADIHSRLRRVVRNAGEAMSADVETIVGRRRDWHLNLTDFGPSVQTDWGAEVTALQKELDSMLQERGSKLADDIKSTVEAAEGEWATVSPDDFALEDLSGFDAVWGNRALRAGVGIGSALAVMAVGFMIGGPVGAAVAVVGGPVAAFAVTPLKNLVDHIFLGKAEVLRRRREEVAKQVGPILDKVTKNYQEAVVARLGELSDRLNNDQRRVVAHAADLDRVASRLSSHGLTLHTQLGELDRETTTALLRLSGRERLARSVKRATRVPGVCILTEFDDLAFWEAWLYPPDIGEKFAEGRTPPPAGQAASALSYALGLVDSPVSMVSAGPEAVHLHIDADIRSAITDTWSDALAAHTGKEILVTTGRKARSA